MDRATLEKALKTINLKNLIAPFMLLLSLVITSCFVDEEKRSKTIDLNSVKNSTNFAKELMKDNVKLNFITDHLFKGEHQDFRKYISNVAEENHVKIMNISCGETTDLNSIEKLSAKIEGVCWHDFSVFELIESIQDFSPGFVKITSINIDKFAKISTSQPAIKTEISCEIFQLKQ